MNYRRVVNKCAKKAEARDLPRRPSYEDKTRPELRTMMMETSLFLSTVILLMQCSPCVPVTVMTNRQKVEVEELKDAVLSCIFFTEIDQKPRIEWKKRGKDVSFVFYNGKFRGPFEGRATIEGATVTLKRVTQEDAGEYRCEISASQDTVSLGETNVTLKVLVPPQIPLCEIPSSAVTGSVVQLRCRDQQGIPPATYSWYKDSQLIRAPHQANATYLINSRTGVLEFKAVTKEDTGRYRCLASNGVGQSKMCEDKHMTIEDVNITAVVATVVVVFLVILVCGCGGFLLQRNGFCSPGHRGRSNVNYIPPPQEPQDFKHTQSFML